MFLDEDTQWRRLFSQAKVYIGEFEFNILAYRSGGGGASCPPSKVFGFFSWTIKHQNLTFSVAVRLSLPRLLRQVW